MSDNFETKKHQFLSDIRSIALRHNRSYYVSLIPLVEQMTPGEHDILDEYIAALDEDRAQLMQSREALITVQRVAQYITL